MVYHLEYRCRHDIMWKVLDYCFEEPKSLSDIYRDLHLKYPLIYRTVKNLTLMEALDAVNQDGSQAFKGRHYFEVYQKTDTELKEFKQTKNRFNMKDFDYQTTELGEALMVHQQEFLTKIMAVPETVGRKMLGGPKTLPKDWVKGRRNSLTNNAQIAVVWRLI